MIFCEFFIQWINKQTFYWITPILKYFKFIYFSKNKLYRFYIRDKSGFIDVRELKAVLKSLEIRATDNEIRNVFKELDADGKNWVYQNLSFY